MQQLTYNIDLACSFCYHFFSFVLIELKPFVLKRKVLGVKFWKSVKKVWKFLKRCCPLWSKNRTGEKQDRWTPKVHLWALPDTCVGCFVGSPRWAENREISPRGCSRRRSRGGGLVGPLVGQMPALCVAHFSCCPLIFLWKQKALRQPWSNINFEHM